MEVLVGHCLRENTGSWHPKRQRAILWHRGSGTGEWKDSYLQNRCLANFWFQHWCPSESLRYLSRPGVINTEFTAYKIRKKKKKRKKKSYFFFFFFFYRFVPGLEGSCREQFCSQLSPLNPHRVCSCKMDESVEQHYMRTFGKSICCAQSLAGGRRRTEGRPRAAGRCSSRGKKSFASAS